ncbi:hypothetical protein V6N13_019773 [Hibiscus sabdariffa]
MTIASYGPSHPSYEEESESKNGMKGELNTFRGESSDSSRENEPKEREIGNAFSTYGFSRGPLGVLRNQVCQRKTMTLSLNMLPKNKESHSICHLFPRFRIEFVQDRSECFFESRCRSLIKQSQAEKQKALHQGWGSLLRLRSNSTSRSERGSTSRNQIVHSTLGQAGFRVETLLLEKRALIARLWSAVRTRIKLRSPPPSIISRARPSFRWYRYTVTVSKSYQLSVVSQCSQIPDPLVSGVPDLKGHQQAATECKQSQRGWNQLNRISENYTFILIKGGILDRLKLPIRLSASTWDHSKINFPGARKNPYLPVWDRFQLGSCLVFLAFLYYAFQRELLNRLLLLAKRNLEGELPALELIE